MVFACGFGVGDGERVDGVGELVSEESGTAVSEVELIGAAREGDPAAIGVLYERHRGPGLKFARALMDHPQDAEDVLHEAFTKSVSAIRNGFGPTDNFGAYLSTSVRSVANTVWKKQARERPTEFDEFHQVAADDPGLETALRVFEHQEIAAAMRTLPGRWRTVLWLGDVMGLRPREIAPMLGIEANAVSSLLIRARAGLRAAYELQTQSAPKPE